MGIPFKRVANRLTGFSTPVFGVSWNPPTLEVEAAQRVLAYLEDRRVLYSPYEVEVPDHVVRSVLDIRRTLTAEAGKLTPSSELRTSLTAMTAACRKFLDQLPHLTGHRSMVLGSDVIHVGGPLHGIDQWIFLTALGEMRGVFGVHIAQLSAKYGIDVSDDLGTILPA